MWPSSEQLSNYWHGENDSAMDLFINLFTYLLNLLRKKIRKRNLLKSGKRIRCTD